MPVHHTRDRDDSGSGGLPAPTELSALFLRAFREVAGSESDASVGSLRVRVCAFVREARERGDPPERVLAALKRTTIDAIDPLYFRGESPEQRGLRETLFRWFLDEYYRAD